MATSTDNDTEPHNRPHNRPRYLAELGERIGELARRMGSKKRLADAAGISESQLYRCIKGTSATTVEPLVAMAQAANVPIEWLILGQGCDGETLTSQMALIPFMDGLRDPKRQPCLGMPQDWLRQRRLSEDQLMACYASGDSMSPTIQPGDLLMVDTWSQNLQDGQIFAFRLDGQVLVKRLQVISGRDIWLMNDNKHYSDMRWSDFSVDGLSIVGRVVWVGKDV